MSQEVADEFMEYKRFHKFTRERFLDEIKMMDDVAKEYNEKPRLKLKEIDKATDLQLIKAHKFYWDKV